MDSFSPNAPGTGTSADPFRSLSHALGQSSSWTLPAIVKVAGRGASIPYKNTAGLSSDRTENFPIEVPGEIQLQDWNPYSGTPLPIQLPAVFLPGDQTSTLTCFSFINASVGTIQEGIRGYMNGPSQQYTDPDYNQGFELRGFDLGIYVADFYAGGVGVGGDLDLVLDGISFYDCQSALETTIKWSDASRVEFKRILMRSAAPAGQTARPLVNVVFMSANTTGAHRFDFIMSSADIRPGNSGMGQSMLVFRGWDHLLDDGPDVFNIDLANIKITGQPSNDNPSSQQYIDGAGIEVGFKVECQGIVNLDNVEIRDAKGEGFLGLVDTFRTTGKLSTQGCSLRFNGAASTNLSPYLSQSLFSSGLDFAESGLHLIVKEVGDWAVSQASESHFSNNYRHGALLEASSHYDEKDGFSRAEFDLCTFSNNGLDSASAVGYGLLATTREATVNLFVHRSVVSGNHTGGIRMDLGDTNPINGGQRAHTLFVSNSTISKNMGLNSQVSMNSLPLDTAPISVQSSAEDNHLKIFVSQCTLTDNSAPYAFTLYGTNPAAQASLWVSGSSSRVDNSVLNKNHYTVGGVTDQAFYPEPVTPQLQWQWQEMFNGTFFSNLGRTRFGTVLSSYYVVANYNFYLDPGLNPLTIFGVAAGNVLPGLGGNVVNMGGFNDAHRNAAEVTDNRGPGHPRKIDDRYDVGAYEVD